VAFSIAVGDFDNNGTLDIAAANYESDSVSILVNQRQSSVLTETYSKPGSLTNDILLRSNGAGIQKPAARNRRK
jgi:hypothetical protein